MRCAVLFPGHAAAIAGLPAAWCRRSEHVRRLMERAAEDAKVPLARLRSPSPMMGTSLYQPALTALALGIWRELVDRGFGADLTAGHSLGEVSASAASGCIRVDDAVTLGATRGRLMDREAARHPGGMLALTARDLAGVEAAIQPASSLGPIVVAGSNLRSQWLVSGATAALSQVASTTHGTLLQVGGAWHSPLMMGAAEEYRAAVVAAISGPITTPLVSNREGQLVTSPVELVDVLVAQLTRRLDWVGCMGTFEGAGVTDFVICGPAKPLSRFVKAAMPSARIHAVEWPEDIGRVMEAVG